MKREKRTNFLVPHICPKIEVLGRKIIRDGEESNKGLLSLLSEVQVRRNLSQSLDQKSYKK